MAVVINTNTTTKPEIFVSSCGGSSIKYSDICIYSYDMFFISARIIDGTRYYSKTVNNIVDARELFSTYIDVVKYFGGGEVDLFCVNDNGYHIVDSAKAF